MGRTGGTSKRTYRSPRRQQQAAATRAAVVAAGRELFAAKGWGGTGIREIAESAGVAVETVYASVGSKLAILLAAVDAAVVGDDLESPLAQRAEFRSIGEGTYTERAAASAHLTTAILERTTGLLTALRDAASADDTAAAQWRELEQRRRDDVGQALTLVAGRPVTDAERDGLWAICTGEVHHLLRNHAGWSSERFESWFSDTIRRLLGPEPPEPPRRRHAQHERTSNDT